MYGEVQGTNSGKQFGIFNEKIEFTFEEGKTYQIQIGYIFDEENATLSAYLGVSDENGEIDRITGVANLDEGQLTLVKNMLSKGDYVFFQNGEVKNVVYNDAYNK